MQNSGWPTFGPKLNSAVFQHNARLKNIQPPLVLVLGVVVTNHLRMTEIET
jgi:hypothetical protein